MRLLRLQPQLNLREIALQTGLKRGSVATKLTELVREGVVMHDGARKGRRYAATRRAA